MFAAKVVPMSLRRFLSSSATTTNSPHEFYSLVCNCGHLLEGERTASSQQVRCPVCETTFYVLPRDVYPTPQIVETPPPEPAAKTITFAPADAPATQKAPRHQTEEESWLDPEPENEYEDQTERLAEPVDLTPKRVWMERPSGKTVRKQLFRVSLAAALLMLLTAWGISRRNEIREAEKNFQLHHERAVSFADEGLWEEAFAEAELGVKAAKILKRQDSASIELFTLFKELEILQNLSNFSPIEIVMQKQGEEFTHEDWERQFRVTHSGRWVILDATVRRNQNEPPNSSEDRKKTVTSYEFEFPVGLEGEDVRFVWSRTPEWFERLSYRDQKSRVLIAAKLHSVRYPAKDSEAWEIVLSADDSHLWTNEPMLNRTLGITSISNVNRDLNTLIESQKQLVLQAERVE